MQKAQNNIIKFESKYQPAEFDASGSDLKDGEVIRLSQQKLFKNASLVDIGAGVSAVVDILVQGDKIVKIAKKIASTAEMEVHNLDGDFVLPAMWNFYAHFDSLVGTIQPAEDNAKFRRMFAEACKMKNLLCGNVNTFPVPGKEVCLLENIQDLDEKDLERLSDDAAKHRKRVVLHVGLTLDELGSVEKKFGKPLVSVLEDFGFLDRPFALVGGNCLEKDDFQTLAQYDGRVVICPMEDAQLGRRTLNIQMLKNLGIEVVLGSGSAIDADLFEAMRQLLSTQRALFEDAAALSEADVLKMGTFGYETLKEGMPADFIVLLNKPTIFENLLSYLVWDGSKSGCLFTVKDGSIVQAGGYINNYRLNLNYYDVLGILNAMKKGEKNDN